MADSTPTPQQIQMAAAFGIPIAQYMAEFGTATGSSSSSTSSRGDIPVYWGPATGTHSFVNPEGGRDGKSKVTVTTPNTDIQTRTIDQATSWLEDQFWNQSADWHRIHDLVVKSGIAGANPTPSDIMAAWDKALTWSASAYSRHQQHSPEDFLSMFIKANGGTSGVAKTQVSTSRNLTSAADAEGMVQTVSQNKLGRNATAAEIAKSRAALNAAEAASPSRTVTSISADGLSQNSSTTGGLNASGAQDILNQQAMQAKDYGSTQAATTYMSALMNDLGQAANSAGA